MTSPSQPRESGQPGESGTALLADAAARARRYLDRLGDRAVAPSHEAVLGLGELDFPLPDAGLEPDRVLAALDDVGSPATVASAGPRYFGFVRVSISNWSTTQADVDRSIAAVLAAAR